MIIDDNCIYIVLYCIILCIYILYIFLGEKNQDYKESQFLGRSPGHHLLRQKYVAELSTPSVTPCGRGADACCTKTSWREKYVKPAGWCPPVISWF